jgi:hypothetical protein
MKALYVFILIAALSDAAVSQPVEIRFSRGRGYQYGGTPLSGYDINAFSDYDGYMYTKTNTKDTYFTVGQGYRFDISVILHLKENIGVIFSSGYSSGFANQLINYRSQNIYEYDRDTFNGVNKFRTEFSYIPLVTGVQFRQNIGALTPYAGVGAGFFLPSGITTYNNYYYTVDSNRYDYWEDTWIHETFGGAYERQTKLAANKPIGAIGFAGINAKLLPRVSLFAEVKATLVSFLIEKIELTKYTVDGRNQLHNLSRSERVIVFKRNQNEVSSDTYNPNIPSYGGPPYPLNGNSIGVTVGFSVQL